MIVAFSTLENLVIRIDSVNAFVPAERHVDTGSGLTGGGDLSQNRTLAVDFATQAEADAGVVTEKAVSPGRLYTALGALAVKAGFAAVLNGNGYIKFPSWLGGLILQWGSGTLPVSNDTVSTVAVIFPTAWPSAMFAAVATARNGVNTAAGGWPVMGSISNTLTQILFTGDVLHFTTINKTVPFTWFAVGK
ncbi:hypothetical protein [Tropicimonas sp. IMCC34043]|uniref:gp53-like domain-containing protein n=1 Tax=Tropicimonas sp. IMCC34043 TaxID=2248760 RepID=UPI000E255DFD|nr:hypothetical protein [Tropicimonas sp. IMCC34043]